MPKLSNPNTTAKPVNSNENTVNHNDSKDDIINQLMKQVSDLTNMINEIKSSNNKNEDKPLDTNELDEVEFKEPSPNKQIRLISLCYGVLNLSTEPYGKGKLVSFNKYGESKTILYSTLIDIVNNNRKFAENGSFYILDKDAVYYLGLSDYYKGILSKDIMDNIFNYSPSEITDLLRNATDEQKEVLVHNTIDKIYNNQPIDLNKADLIGKSCGINIMNKVSEMKNIDEAMKQSK